MVRIPTELEGNAVSPLQAERRPTPNPLSIYLHIPFCAVRCTYCAFNTYTQLDHLVPSFVQALCREIRLVGEAQQQACPGQTVHTVFFGGGTPSQLTVEQFGQIFSALHSAFAIAEDAEISLEANPADMTADYALGLRAVGFNRISFGMQSANTNELDLFHRRHTQEDVVGAVAYARAAGFDNLNLDLIYGVPHQTMQSWQRTVEAALALQPEHLSLYGLVLEEGTAMHSWVERGALPQPDDDLAADMDTWLGARLAKAGYNGYEISNWALPGRACRHNLQYWRSGDYLGFGPGAHGWINSTEAGQGGTRYWTVLSPHRYIRLLSGDEAASRDYPLSPAVDEASELTVREAMSEALLMGLRLMQEGIRRPAFAERFGVDPLDEYGDVFARHVANGLLTLTPDRIQLTAHGRMLSNIVFRDLV